jgi:hypothetical protein
MPLAGICKSCGEISYGLRICTYCGARVCPVCLETRQTPCKLCKKVEEEPDEFDSLFS